MCSRTFLSEIRSLEMHSRNSCKRRFVLSYIVHSLIDIFNRSGHCGRHKRGSARIKMISCDSIDCIKSVFHTIISPAAVSVNIYKACCAYFALGVKNFAFFLIAYGKNNAVFYDNVAFDKFAFSIYFCVFYLKRGK